MSDTGNKKTAAELDDALRLLDHELDALGLDTPLQMRAIGGYALMKHGVREDERAFTVDIDTVTRDYSAAVVQAIKTVAEQASLDEDWLNNYNVMDNDPDQVEEMIAAEWLPQPLGLRNIAVSIATIETLTRAKIIAVDNIEFSGREQDEPDLRDLLAHQGITTAKQFAAKYPDPYGEYPETAALIRDHFAADAAKSAASSIHTRFPELKDANLDPYGLDDDDDQLIDHGTGFYR